MEDISDFELCILILFGLNFSNLISLLSYKVFF
jgi:hypothetical protein